MTRNILWTSHNSEKYPFSPKMVFKILIELFRSASMTKCIFRKFLWIFNKTRYIFFVGNHLTPCFEHVIMTSKKFRLIWDTVSDCYFWGIPSFAIVYELNIISLFLSDFLAIYIANRITPNAKTSGGGL